VYEGSASCPSRRARKRFAHTARLDPSPREEEGGEGPAVAREHLEHAQVALLDALGGEELEDLPGEVARARLDEAVQAEHDERHLRPPAVAAGRPQDAELQAGPGAGGELFGRLLDGPRPAERESVL
jgi:hypothetical protein